MATVVRRRVVIISASVGAGHDGAAAQWARRLRELGFEVDVYDFLVVLGRVLGVGMRDVYETVLHRAPSIYSVIFRLTTLPVGAALLARNLLAPFLPRLLDLFPPDTAAVVTTYPMAGQLIGKLRRRGLLTVPAFTFLTDFSVHRLCVAPGVDAHYVLHPVSAAQARALGATNVTVTGPLVADRFHPAGAAERRAARERFGLPADGRLALLVAGSWGVGDVERTAREIAATGVAVPVVVCGRNTALRERLADAAVGFPLGWVDDMPELMRAVDVLVENAGGLTSLEAMASGLPVASYRPIPGHGRTNAAALAQAGVSSWIRSPAALATTLAELVDGPRSRRQRAAGLALFENDPMAVALPAIDAAHPLAADRRAGGTVLGTRRRLGGRGGPAWERWARRAAVAAVTAAVVGWNATIGTQIAVAHGLDAARPGERREVSVIVHVSPQTRLDAATVLRLRDERAAVAIDTRFLDLRPDSARTLAGSGLTLVNAGGGQPYETGIVGGRSAIRRAAVRLRREGGRSPRYFLSDGDLDAVDLGIVTYLHEIVVRPSRSVDGGSVMPPLQQGEIVLVECAQQPDCGLATTFAGLDRQTAGQEIRVGSLSEPAT
ncbi:hypothetical protein MXD60_27950 [Frankia sp. AgB32]|nr:hypothetical protein [Frankia sp. AgB32]